MLIGKALRQARTRLGWTQAELARVSGVREETISRAERGTSVPSADTLEKLAGALGVPPEYWVNPAVVEDAFSRLGNLSRCFLGLALSDQVLLLEICARLMLPLREDDTRAA